MADARVAANRFLHLARDNGRGLTPMQVLKLVYIAHGWMLGSVGRGLIEQPVEAWQYGPVIRDLYNAMRGSGGSQVVGDLAVSPDARALDPVEEHYVSQVHQLYGKMNGIQLSSITHAQGTPWQQTYRPGALGTVISPDLIAEHYQRLAHERANPAAA